MMILTPQEMNSGALWQALTRLGLDSAQARVLLIAIALQESGLATRKQYHGPAHGFWQFESEGVAGVLQHAASANLASLLCSWRQVAFDTQAVYNALLTDDVLAAGIARLLLWTDPAPLPSVGDVDAAWNYYDRNWRPGAPRPAAWAYNYSIAQNAVIEA